MCSKNANDLYAAPQFCLISRLPFRALSPFFDSIPGCIEFFDSNEALTPQSEQSRNAGFLNSTDLVKVVNSLSFWIWAGFDLENTAVQVPHDYPTRAATGSTRTQFPYGVVGIGGPCEFDFGSRDDEKGANASNWRNLSVWLPYTCVFPGQRLVVKTTVHATSFQPNYTFRVELQCTTTLVHHIVCEISLTHAQLYPRFTTGGNVSNADRQQRISPLESLTVISE